MMTHGKIVVYIDVDDTLVRSSGGKRIPMSAMVAHVRELSGGAVILYCWSSGGADYARSSARELGIESCFVGFLPKPNVVIDDRAPEQWRRLICLHPAEAVSKTVQNYSAILTGDG